MMINNQEEAKALIEETKKSAYAHFKAEVLDGLQPPIPPEAEDFVHRVFDEGFTCGATFVSTYMMQMMLISKLKQALGLDAAEQGMPTPEVPKSNPNTNGMSSQDLFKSIFGSSKPIIPKPPKKGDKR